MHLLDEVPIRSDTPDYVNCAFVVSCEAEVQEVYFVRDICVQGYLSLLSKDVDKTQAAEDFVLLILEKVEEDHMVV